MTFAFVETWNFLNRPNKAYFAPLAQYSLWLDQRSLEEVLRGILAALEAAGGERMEAQEGEEEGPCVAETEVYQVMLKLCRDALQ